MNVKCSIRTRSCNSGCGIKAINFTHSECVFVARGLQHVMRLGLLPSPLLQKFLISPHKWHDFGNTAFEHKMCVSIFSTTFVQIIFYSEKK